MNLFDLSPVDKARMSGGMGNMDPHTSRYLESLMQQSMPEIGAPARKPLSKFQQMKDQFFGVPDSLRGMLSPEDLSGAQDEGLLGLGLSLLSNSGARTMDQQVRPMEAIGQGLAAAKGAHSGYLKDAVGQRAAGMEFEGKKLQLDRAKSLDAGRKSIVAKYPMPQATDRMAQWIDQVLPHFIEINDEETVSRLSEIRKSIGGQQQKVPGNWVEVPGPDGKPRSRYITAAEAGPDGVPIYKQDPRVQQARRLIPIINQKTGKPELAEYNPGTGKFTFTGQKPTTTGAGSEAERKAQAMYELSAPHVALLDQADAPDRIEQAALKGKLNEVLSQNRQLFDISGRQLADAYLRLTTGAAYNKEELEQARILITPQPGDDVKTIALKRANRKRLLNALRAAAGRAFNEVDMDVGVELDGGMPEYGGGMPEDDVVFPVKE